MPQWQESTTFFAFQSKCCEKPRHVFRLLLYCAVPTVLTIRNIRVAIYANDHPPPHVHAIRRGGGRAKFELNCPDGPVRLVEQAGFRLVDIKEIGALIASSLEAICDEWRRVHG